MKSAWNDDEARLCTEDPVTTRVYTSRLLGREPALVLHGGGNTSVKVREKDFFDRDVDVLYVKGSGWDLASLEAPGLSPVRLDVLLDLADLPELTDSDMVRVQRTGLLDPYAPNPSVEAILHAIIPFRFVDHSHADAVVTVSNSPGGEQRIRDLYGDRVLVIPYVMPGFVLAKAVREATRGIDWSRLEGMVLLNHGVFTFHNDARTSYERMIWLVSEAEDYLREHGAWDAPVMASDMASPDLESLARLRSAVSARSGGPVIARLDGSAAARGFAGRADIADLATRGPVTPDHVIRTRRVPVVLGDDFNADLERFRTDYEAYFADHDDGTLTRLNSAPAWAVWPGQGVVAFGRTPKAAGQVEDIARHTARCFQWGEALGGWQPLGASDIFEMEYWELEQAKLKKGGATPPLAGQVALVTGAASGIGKATLEALQAAGAAVCGVDIQPDIVSIDGPTGLGVVADVTDSAAVNAAVDACVARFGGLDFVVSNAGNFPPSEPVEDIRDESWTRTLDLNLTAHMKVLRAASRYLPSGVDPAVVVIASRNVPAPGPGVGAYSASKAALTQLARVAALELAPTGVRVNVLHPDKVFDTDLWDDTNLALRAEHYGLTIDEYKRNNMLQREVRAADVAALAVAMLGPLFRCTTGAQVPVDGGNDRVI